MPSQPAAALPGSCWGAAATPGRAPRTMMTALSHNGGGGGYICRHADPHACQRGEAPGWAFAPRVHGWQWPPAPAPHTYAHLRQRDGRGPLGCAGGSGHLPPAPAPAASSGSRGDGHGSCHSRGRAPAATPASSLHPSTVRSRRLWRRRSTCVDLRRRKHDVT